MYKVYSKYLIFNLIALICFIGCKSGQINPGIDGSGAISQPPDPRLQVADTVLVRFSGPGSPGLEDHQENIKPNGTITLSQIGSLQAAGKTPAELQSEIQSAYDVYYRNLTVIVEAVRYFYVDGDVISSGKFQYSEDMTVTKAIAQAGGFNNFARTSGVELKRATGGEPIIVNANRAREDARYDFPVYPGDQIWVPRRIAFE